MKPEDKLVHAIISSEVALNYLEQVKYTPYFEKDLKAKVNLALKSLLKHSKLFEAFADSVEDSAIDVFDEFYDYIRAISSVEIPHMSNIITIIEAYKTDPKAIEGIVNKILK